MTDWLPWGALLMATTFASLAALTREGDPAANRRLARRLLLVGGALTVGSFLLYVVFGERWIPY